MFSTRGYRVKPPIFARYPGYYGPRYTVYVVPQIDSCLRSKLTHLRLKSSCEVRDVNHWLSEVPQLRSEANKNFFFILNVPLLAEVLFFFNSDRNSSLRLIGFFEVSFEGFFFLFFFFRTVLTFPFSFFFNMNG